jgi:hypothetical protein
VRQSAPKRKRLNCLFCCLNDVYIRPFLLPISCINQIQSRSALTSRSIDFVGSRCNIVSAWFLWCAADLVIPSHLFTENTYLFFFGKERCTCAPFLLLVVHVLDPYSTLILPKDAFESESLIPTYSASREIDRPLCFPVKRHTDIKYYFC